MANRPYSSSSSAAYDHSSPRRPQERAARSSPRAVTPRSGLRVAVATPTFPPELGGLGNHVRNLATALADEGCETTVLTQAHGTATEPCVRRRHGGAAVKVLSFQSRLGGRRFSYAPSLRRYARSRSSEFDVVHAFSFHAPVALAVSGTTTAPFFFSPVFHRSGHSRLAGAAHVVYRTVARRTFDRADAVLCSSKAERADVLERYPFCADWADVIPIAVDWDRYADVEPFESDRPVVLSACRLDRYKRVDLVLEAMRSLRDRATLVICGGGPDEQRLKHLAQEYGVAEVTRFVGVVPDADVRRWQRTAAVTVSLSTRESFGLSVAEGIVAGSRIVASDIPAHRETASAMGASPTFVTVSATHDELATALLEAIAEGRPAPFHGVRRAWSDVARDTIAAYEAALAHPRRAR